MNSSARHSGYTIIEVMIFLAVSGFMFVLAAAFVNGKQASAEFKQGMSSTASMIQGMINDVNNGSYPSNGNFSCLPTTSGPSFSVGSDQQGKHQGCISLGKVLQFGIKSGSNTDKTKYDVYTVAGNQYVNATTDGGSDSDEQSGELSTTFGEAKPQIDGDFTETTTLEWGLEATKMCSGGSCTASNAVGFFGSFGSYSGSALKTGSQTVNVAVIPSVSVNTGASDSDMKSYIENYLIHPALIPNPNIVICFVGGNGQHGSITIGGNSSQRITIDAETGNNIAGDCDS